MSIVKPRRQFLKEIIFPRKKAESVDANADGRHRSSSFADSFHDNTYDADRQRKSRGQKFEDLWSKNTSPSSNDNGSESHKRIGLTYFSNILIRLPKSVIIEVDESSGRNALHSACRDNFLFHKVRKIVRDFPDAVEMRDNDLKTPLHHAAESNTSTKVIGLLLTKSAKTLLMKDSAGKTPLHLLCEKSNNFDVGTIIKVQKMVSACPQVLEVVDDSSQTPLHIASERCSLEVIQFLIHHNRKALSVRDRHGKTPFHNFLLSMASRNKHNIDDIKYFIDQDDLGLLVVLSFCLLAPLSLLTNDEYGMRPLEYAIMYGSHYELIKELQEQTNLIVKSLHEAYTKRGNRQQSSVLRISRARITEISCDETIMLDDDLEEITS
eukprot:CAMPEP_0195524440 /NCGR_PEP_ID=MMETSP0794_2-20130614/24261_1 /TAXON_ID=515487 /ORGANISM="Stephanopyxis turris, Strain CCMP 815" /LENGTH=379 /DNA_ID=CAMNT_0040654655 /DNA_START=100 /DNA_END=1239 /DNA_ORIENTATION=+